MSVRQQMSSNYENDTDLTDEEAQLNQKKGSWKSRSTNGLMSSWRESLNNTSGFGWLNYAFQSIIVILLVIILFMLIAGVQEIKNHAIFVTPLTGTSHGATADVVDGFQTLDVPQIAGPPKQPVNAYSPVFHSKTDLPLPQNPITEVARLPPPPPPEPCSCTKVQHEISSVITTLRQLAPHDRPLEGVDELDQLMKPIEHGGSNRHEYNGRERGIPFSYSQLNQDTELFNRYPMTFQKRMGTYLEIGGLNGYYLSNTYMYERFLDWTGMLVEMNPHWGDLGELSRPGSIWINGAISAENGTVEVGYTDGYSAGLAGLTSVADNARIQREMQARPQNWITARVPTYSLGKVLPKYGLNRIDFFSLDVEGAEYFVLETVDWSVTKFHFLLIEVNARMEECATLLKSHGYQLLDTWDQDQLWTLPDHLWNEQTCTPDQCHGLQNRLQYFKEKHKKYVSGKMKYPPPHLALLN